MPVDYTRKQREIINRAWAYAEALADEDMTARRQLREAERHERRERSSQSVARALILECLFNLDSLGEDRVQPYTVADLFHIADGCAFGVILGAKWREWAASEQSRGGRGFSGRYAQALGLAREAARVHNASVHTALDRVGKAA